MYSTLDLTKSLKKINLCDNMLVSLGLDVNVTRNIGLPKFPYYGGVPYMCVCVCVCVCVYVYVYVYVCINVCMHVFMYIYT